jgi:hypothetical protein
MSYEENFLYLGTIVVLLFVVPSSYRKSLYLGWATSAVESRYDVKLTSTTPASLFSPRLRLAQKRDGDQGGKGRGAILKAERLRVAIGWMSLLSKQPSLIIGLKKPWSAKPHGRWDIEPISPRLGRTSGAFGGGFGNLSVAVPEV